MKRPDPIAKKSGQSFLKRFQGKKNAISKQGLLYLFEAQRNSKPNLRSEFAANQQLEKRRNHRNEHREYLEERIALLKRIGSNNQENEEGLKVKKVKASRMTNQTEMVRRNPSRAPEKYQAMFPRINRLSSSPTNPKYRASSEVELRHSEYENRRRAEKGLLMGSHLDNNALQHLQFLNKFEEKLLNLKRKQVIPT